MSEIKNFEQIKHFAANISRSKKLKKDDSGYSVPDAVGIKLTNRCNLRCKHCYEWNKQGYHHQLSDDIRSMDVDFEIIKKCVEETRESNAMFYLWGGEPFVYRNISETLKLLSDEKRFTVICTNGLLIDKYIEVLCLFDERIELLFALDGDCESNDALRGNGNYALATENIFKMISLKKDGDFKGTISVHTMVSNENLAHLEEHVDYLDRIGTDQLILCFPWYISENTSCEMDTFFQENLNFIHGEIKSVPSWHAYKYKITPENYDAVHNVINKIKGKKRRMNIRYQPDIIGDELTGFLEGRNIANCAGRECYTIYSRLDVLPTGDVSPCKHFQELAYGNLHNHSLLDLWNSEKLKEIRRILSEKQMPVCSKCNNLYQHSYKSTKEN